MTLEEIKALMPQYLDWKLNIGFWYGDEYVKRYCTWKRFLEHIEIYTEVVNDSSRVKK